MAIIHPTAVVDVEAQLSSSVEVGAHCHIGAGVEVGENTRFGPGVIVQGPTRIGSGNYFHAQSSVGSDSQALKGSSGSLEIGDHNEIREYVTINRATASGAVTRIGDHNLFMACSHVAHDCRVGNHNVLANSVLLGGEVELENRVILGGNSAVHQRVRIGFLAIVGGVVGVRQDVPPFANYVTNDSRIAVSVNIVGLQRAGLKESISVVKQAFRILYRSGLSLKEATSQISKLAQENKILAPFVSFIAAPSCYGLVRPRSSR